MKFVSTIVGFVLFILFFGFALKNTKEVDLHFFLDYELRGPLVLMLLAFFVAGAAFGKYTIQALQSAAGTGVVATTPPPPDAVPPVAPRH
jgi:putative membrane protein